MERIKALLRPLYVPVLNYKDTPLYKSLELKANFIADYKLYKKYSIVFAKKDIKNKEADIILHYHSVEKGLLYENMKRGFAKHRITNLHKMLHDDEIVKNADRDQIKTAYQIMCEYYELHQKANYNIADFYTEAQYEFYRNILNRDYQQSFSGKIDWTKDSFYKDVESNFYDFAHSRKSVRNFSGEYISHELLDQVIDLANTAPSVCNRQANNVYLIEEKEQIDRILKIQGGFTGYTENVRQLLILTNDRKYYYTIGERNQLYIDGGAYLMNLLYALHFYKIANCPANWGKKVSDEKELSKIISIPPSEKIICMIPIGIAKEEFRTTLSCRRSANENFFKL